MEAVFIFFKHLQVSVDLPAAPKKISDNSFTGIVPLDE